MNRQPGPTTFVKLLKSVLVLSALTLVVAFAWTRPSQQLQFDSTPLAPIHVSAVSYAAGRLSFTLRPSGGDSVHISIAGHDWHCGRPRARVSCRLPERFSGHPFRVTVVK